jgi:endonuclease/exonuclease/phosphatase family metal-dependent hydrolase
MMSPSRRRLLTRIWVTLAVILFASQCAIKLRPYLKSIAGARDAAPAGPPASRPTARSAQLGSLRLASWNLQFLDVAGRGPDRRTRADYEALTRYARELDADVIAVQEVASEAALELVFSREMYAFHLAARGGSQRTGFVFRRGLEARVLPDLDQLALTDLRAGSDLALRVGGRELRLLAVHLKAFCVTGSLAREDKDCRKLAAQLPALEGWIDARAREGTAFAVVGDFNRALGEAHDALLRELDDADPPALTLRLAGPRAHSECQPGRRRHAIDHVLLGGAAVRWLAPEGLRELAYRTEDRAQGRKLSDHCPIQLVLAPPGAH